MEAMGHLVAGITESVIVEAVCIVGVGVALVLLVAIALVVESCDTVSERMRLK